MLFSGLDLVLQPGQALQVAGANGRGKTTLLRTLAGLQRPVEGAVHWGGVDIHEDIDGYAGQLLYLAHENALNPDLTPMENLDMLQRLRGGDSGGVRAALHELGIDRARNRPCRHLSAGQRRRTALAQLLLSQAPLWLLDEPAAALDAGGRERIGRCIAEHASGGGCVLFTTHEPLTLPGLETRILELPQ